MLPIDASFIHDLVAALFCGAFIGMERERGKVGSDADASKPSELMNLAGIRSHMLVALFGALVRVVDVQIGGSPPGLLFSALGFAAVALFAVTAHGVRAARTGHYGMTSVPTLLVTFALGLLCVAGHRPLALALAVVVTVLLAIKVPLHSFVHRLQHAELAAAVKFALLALVLLPLLPDRDFGPLDWPWLAARLRSMGAGEATLARLALANPHQLWLLVVIISGVGFVGYVLVRFLGPGRGLLLTGFSGGLVSSTSVALAMAEQSRHTPKWKDSFAAAVLAACTVMTARVLIVAVALHPSLFRTLGLPLGLMGLGNLVFMVILARRGGRATEGSHAEGHFEVATPLAFWPAVKLTGLILLVRIASELAIFGLGNSGLLVIAGLSGLADVDAITIATAQQAAGGQIATQLAALAIFIAVAANTLTKGTIVFAMGDRATGKVTLVALLITLLAAAAGFALVTIGGIG